MNKNRRGLISVCLAAALVIFGSGLPTPTRAEVVGNVKVPFARLVFVPCVPEFILLTGEVHTLVTLEVDSNGGFHRMTHFQPQGISGVGMVTGAKYQGAGVTQTHINDPSSPAFENTFMNNFRIIGQGPGNNLLLHMTLHVTINAEGVVTATVMDTSIECK